MCHCEKYTSFVLAALSTKGQPNLPSNCHLNPFITVKEETKPIVEGKIQGEETLDNTNSSDNHGITLLVNNGVLGITHIALTQPSIGIDPIIVLSPSKVELFGPKPQQSALNVNSTSPTDIENDFNFMPSTLLNQTSLGTWKLKPPLT
jgi:hypothetical protein